MSNLKFIKIFIRYSRFKLSFIFRLLNRFLIVLLKYKQDGYYQIVAYFNIKRKDARWVFFILLFLLI